MESLVGKSKKESYKSIENKVYNKSNSSVERSLLDCVPCNSINDPIVYLHNLNKKLNINNLTLNKLVSDFNSLDEFNTWIDSRKQYIYVKFTGTDLEQV